MQTPVQAAEPLPASPDDALLHAYGQVAPVFCHVPDGSHCCGCWPLHRVAPGLQAPEHLPDTHVWPEHAGPGLS